MSGIGWQKSNPRRKQSPENDANGKRANQPKKESKMT